MRSLFDGPMQWIKKARGLEGANPSARAGEGSVTSRADLAEVMECEWLATNRKGSFAFGSVDRVPRRKYCSLMTLREPPFGEPLNLLVDLGERVEIGRRTVQLHQLRFVGDVSAGFPEDLVDFAFEPTPCWFYDLGSARIRRLLQLDEHEGVCIYYRVDAVVEPLTISLLPFLCCRPFHNVARVNPVLNGQVRIESHGFSVQLYPGVPRVCFALEGHDFHFEPDGVWYRSIDYSEERERGYAASEDLYVPGELCVRVDEPCEFAVWIGVEQSPGDFGLARRAAVDVSRSSAAPRPLLSTAVAAAVSSATTAVSSATAVVSSLSSRFAASHHVAFGHAPNGERLSDRLRRATFAFKVQGSSPSLIAGYPWFGKRARDILLSLPGACLAQGDRAGALERLEDLARRRVSGLIPNDLSSPAARLDAVDPSLLFIDVVRRMSRERWDDRLSALMPVVCELLDALKGGADARVTLSDRGEIHVASGPWALTWMDVMIGGTPVVPRAGFTVELNALLVAALRFAVPWAAEHDRAFAERWAPIAERAGHSFVERFCTSGFAHLADCHDGRSADYSLRPNQLWAIANEALPLSPEVRANALEAIRTQLLTPVGLRTLSPFDPEYRATYQGDAESRDRAYHQGTSWPFLLGLYAEAVLLVHGDGRLRDELEPIFARITHHLDAEACLGQISECFDGDAPHFPGGAPAYAASAAELYRVAKMVGM